MNVEKFVDVVLKAGLIGLIILFALMLAYIIYFFVKNDGEAKRYYNVKVVPYRDEVKKE